MKKAIIIGPAYPYRGGLAAFNQRFARELDLNGFHTIIYTFKLQYPSIFFPGKTQVDTEQDCQGLDIRPRINSINPLNWIQVGNEIVKLDPDIVICRYWIPFFGPSLGTILRFVKRQCSAEIIALVDNFIPHEKRLGDWTFTNYFLGPIDSFLVMSDKVRNDLRRAGQRKPVIKLPHPVYDNYGARVDRAKALRQLGLPMDKTYLLFFGFVRKYKGLDLLIKAMADPILKKTGVTLIIAGEFYEKEEKFRSLIQKENVSEQVILYPQYIPDTRVKYFFSASDLVVLPYRSASQSGISQIAFNFWKPVLITDVGGLAEIVEEGLNGFVTLPEPEHIAQGIRRFLEVREKVDFTSNIRQRNDLFSWDAFTTNLLLQLLKCPVLPEATFVEEEAIHYQA
jgi:glycosyltransferase involved in cell wall biosynthesis